MTGDLPAVLAALGPDLTAREWASRLGVSQYLVTGIAAAHGLALAPDPIRKDRLLTDDQRAALVSAHRAGFPASRPSAAFGVSETTVRRLSMELS